MGGKCKVMKGEHKTGSEGRTCLVLSAGPLLMGFLTFVVGFYCKYVWVGCVQGGPQLIKGALLNYSPPYF